MALAPRYVGLVRIPSPTTLRRYGLTETTWRAILKSQKGVCGSCGKVPPSGSLQVDHEHVRGFKKLNLADKHLYVRGLLCWFCNSVLLRKGATPEKLRGAASYLENYNNKSKTKKE